MQDLKGVGLQPIGLFEFRLCGTMLSFRGEQNAQGEMDLHVVFLEGGKLRGGSQGVSRAASLEVGARQVEARRDVWRPDTQQVGNSFSRLLLRRKHQA